MGDSRERLLLSEGRGGGVDCVVDGGVEMGGVDVRHGEAGVVGVLPDDKGVETGVDEVCQAGVAEGIELHFLGEAGCKSHPFP